MNPETNTHSTASRDLPPTNKTLTCPVCSEPLYRTPKQFICPNNHQFDIAKQGYVNLLQPQHKKSKQPGDSQPMIEARFRFLDGGYYEPISNRLNELISSDLSNLSDLAAKNATAQHYHIVDAGCGEGYYTHRLQQYLQGRQNTSAINVTANIIGFDISQKAVRAACRRDKSIQWITATSSHIPVASGSQDAVLCLFSRVAPEEFGRILKKDGILYVASTGPDHLIELREMLYQSVKQSSYPPTQALSERLVPLDDTRHANLNYRANVNSNQAIGDLLLMTPHYWRTTESAKNTIQTMESISLTIDIRLTGYRLWR